MPISGIRIVEEVDDRHNVYIVHLGGQLDTHGFDDLNNTIQAHLDSGHYRLLLDMAQVEFIASTCVGVILNAATVAADNGGRIVLLKPAPKVKVVFELFGLADMFGITNDLPAALAQFDK